jgi:NAD-dependent deacetylase
MSELAERIARAAELLHRARHVVALTGAGVSTASGIPDFRSAGSGLWEKVDPLEVASLPAFRYHPERFYHWLRPFAQLMQTAQPNAAHFAFAQLEQQGRLQVLLTQNIDQLHSRAGSCRVVELHGSLRETVCGQCHRRWPGEPVLTQFIADGQVPHCPECGGVLKPDAILLGEALSERVLRESSAAVRACDVLIVAGSSLEVMPAAGLPYEAVSTGARLIMMNHEPTYMDERAEVILRGDLAAVLPELTATLGAEPYA